MIRFRSTIITALLACSVGLATTSANATKFDIPAQRADRALAQFTAQSTVQILYSPTDLRTVQANEVKGTFEPADALTRLLRDTGFGARQQNDRYFVTRIKEATGELVGRITTANGEPNRGTRVYLPKLERATTTNRHGEYVFEKIPPGTYVLVATRDAFHPLQINDIAINADDRTYLAPQALQPAHQTAELETVVVEGRLNRRGPLDPGPTIWGPRQAGGNLDLNRTASDALPFTVYDRDRIARSGVVNLNEFLQRELLDTDATAVPPEQNGSSNAVTTGSTNLSLRGFSSEETIVLVNGRRLPEILTAESGPLPPDVNFIPLSLVQQVQVLPVSASALYSGNAVGGVINIILRPDQTKESTEVTATYTNATEGFDAAYSSLSLLHTESLLDGALHVRLNANFVNTVPATDSELHYHRDRVTETPQLTDPVYRATPNIRSVDAVPLWPGSDATVTSVAPGADGSGGLAAFTGRQGLRNFALYDSPGSMASSLNSIDYPYGRRQRRALYFLSSVYETAPWLELGVDAAYSTSVVHRGFDVFTGDLTLAANHPFNPFGTAINVALNETPVALGQNFNEARLDFYSLVGTALISLPADWKVAFDAQYAHSATQFRGVVDVDDTRWQSLVDRGIYNPLRDTQTSPPPAEFYDEALIYAGHRGDFLTVGDYETLDAALRLSNEGLSLPTGTGILNFGTDYRIGTLHSYVAEQRYGDGSLVRAPDRWEGRTLERISVFGELQAPVLPRNRLPNWINTLDADLAARYIVADTATESNLAPTLALKLALANGITVRGSLTTSNRFPTPYMSSNVGNGIDAGGGINYQSVYDPRRNETYDVEDRIVINPSLTSESAVTQTIGLVFERGERHHLRFSLDFFDTRKTNEIVGLGATALLNLESLFPDRIERAPLSAGDPHAVGRVTTVRSGAFNLASRHSQNWSGTLDYTVGDVLGGTFDLHGRLVYFQRYDREILAGDPVVDEIRHPSGSAAGLLQYRATYGASWSTRNVSVGFDGQYFHSRRLPETEWLGQGARTIDPYWQFDLYTQADLGHYILPADSRFGLRGQLRVNNVFGRSYPFYANESNGTGVQPYGDWRGRTFSISLTAEF